MLSEHGRGLLDGGLELPDRAGLQELVPQPHVGEEGGEGAAGLDGGLGLLHLRRAQHEDEEADLDRNMQNILSETVKNHSRARNFF